MKTYFLGVMLKGLFKFNPMRPCRARVGADHHDCRGRSRSRSSASGRMLLLVVASVLVTNLASAEGELDRIKRQREVALLSIRHEADVKSAKLDQEYQSALDELYRRFVTQNNLTAASEVLRERREVFPGAENPAAGLPSASSHFSWADARGMMTYKYRSKSFAKSAYDYSDTESKKLTDGVSKDFAFTGTVAWDVEKPALVLFEFAVPVKPSRFRVHVLGGMPKNGYKPPRSVVVSDGDRINPGREIGSARDLKDKSDWIDIDIQPTRPSQYFWVAIEKADAQLVCIDEVEFR